MRSEIQGGYRVRTSYNRAEIAVKQHNVLKNEGRVTEIPSAGVIPAVEGSDRTSIIEKGTSMIEQASTFSPREFITITEMAAQLTDRFNLGGEKEDETLAVFRAPAGREITIQHRTTDARASVNIAFLNTEGVVEKRIVVGTNFKDEGHFGKEAGDFRRNYVYDRDAKKTEAVYFNGDDQPKDLSGEEAKFVGEKLFEMALR